MAVAEKLIKQLNFIMISVSDLGKDSEWFP